MNRSLALTLAAVAATVGITTNGTTAHADGHDWHRAARLCARSTFLADDYAHTGDKPAGYHRAIVACADAVGGF